MFHADFQEGRKVAVCYTGSRSQPSPNYMLQGFGWTSPPPLPLPPRLLYRSHKYSVTSFATLRVLICPHSHGLRCSCSRVVSFFDPKAGSLVAAALVDSDGIQRADSVQTLAACWWSFEAETKRRAQIVYALRKQLCVIYVCARVIQSPV